MVPTAECRTGCAKADSWGTGQETGGLRPYVRQHYGWESLAPSTKEGRTYCPVWLNRDYWGCTQRLSTAKASPAGLLYSRVQSLTRVLQVTRTAGYASLEPLSQQEASERGAGAGAAAGAWGREALQPPPQQETPVTKQK